MPKTENPQAVRLYGSVLREAGEEAAARVAYGEPLAKTPSESRKSAWAESAMAALESEFDDTTVRRIRMGCACGPGEGRIAKLKKIYDASDGGEDFAARASASGGFTVEWDGEAFHLIYPRCYCSFVKNAQGTIRRTWCYCTLGYAKRMFEGVLGREVEVELLESVKTGGSECRIRIT